MAEDLVGSLVVQTAGKKDGMKADYWVVLLVGLLVEQRERTSVVWLVEN